MIEDKQQMQALSQHFANATAALHRQVLDWCEGEIMQWLFAPGPRRDLVLNVPEVAGRHGLRLAPSPLITVYRAASFAALAEG